MAYSVVTLSAWREFRDRVLATRSKRGYVWRGQKGDEPQGWLLQSKFDREVKSKNDRERNEKLKRHLENFKNEMRNSFPNVLPDNDIDIWALGQHYGLRTPLLDWTLSPFIAAYFAFEAQEDASDPNDRYRYVYALNRSIGRLLSKKKSGSKVLSRERSVPFIEKVPHANPRLSAQKGILTQAFLGKDIMKYVDGFSRLVPGEVGHSLKRPPSSVFFESWRLDGTLMEKTVPLPRSLWRLRGPFILVNPWR